MHSSECKQMPTRQGGPFQSYGMQRAAVEQEGNPHSDYIFVKGV